MSYEQSPVFQHFLSKVEDSRASNRLRKWFSYGHLPPHLAKVSRLCGELAAAIDEELPEGAEKSAGLRKLLEAKDCFVRGAIEAAEAVPLTADDPGDEA